MSIYLIVEVEVHNKDAYEDYKKAVKPLLETAGGEILAQDRNIEVLKGDWHPSRITIFKWPSKEAAEHFLASEQYQPLKKLRESLSTEKTVILVEGIDQQGAMGLDLH